MGGELQPAALYFILLHYHHFIQSISYKIHAVSRYHQQNERTRGDAGEHMVHSIRCLANSHESVSIRQRKEKLFQDNSRMASLYYGSREAMVI